MTFYNVHMLTLKTWAQLKNNPNEEFNKYNISKINL